MKISIRRAVVPLSALDVAKYKSTHNKRAVVRIADNTQMHIQHASGRLVVRKVGNKTPKAYSSKAIALKACKGKGAACIANVFPGNRLMKIALLKKKAAA